jgi:hypothetical protein
MAHGNAAHSNAKYVSEMAHFPPGASAAMLRESWCGPSTASVSLSRTNGGVVLPGHQLARGARTLF